MAETDLKIKDAPLSTNISGNVRMAGSDGSGLPVAISLSQVYDFINNGLKSDAYFATKEESDNRYPKKSDVVKMMPVEVFNVLSNYAETGTTMTEDDYNTLLSFVTTTTTPSSSNYGIEAPPNNYLVDYPGWGFVKVYITNSSNEIRIQAYMTLDIDGEGYPVWVISKEDKLVTFSQSQKLIHAEAAGEIGIDVKSLDPNGSPIRGSITLKTNGSGDKVLCDNGEYIPIESYTTATTVASLDVNYKTIYVTLSENASLSASGTGSTYNGKSITAYVYTASSVTITIPTSGDYISMCGSSFTTTADGWVEFSLVCVNGVWHIAKLEAE